MKIIEAIDKIKQFHQPYKWSEKTRDLVLAGDVNEECTGVCVTCCATFEILEKCVEKGLNLIVSHEGITYNYEKLGNPADCDNEVVKKKLDYIKEHHLVVWRDHDAMHGPGGPNVTVREKADMIYYGTMKELGWEEYLTQDEMKPLWYTVPEMSAKEFAQLLIEKWNLNGLRIVGNPESRIKTVFICEHALGGERDVALIDKCQKADAIIPLEIVDYTVTTYVRDAAYLGMNKVIFEMGHFNAEELGMKYLEKVLPDAFDHQLKVEFIQSGDGFKYIVK